MKKQNLAVSAENSVCDGKLENQIDEETKSGGDCSTSAKLGVNAFERYFSAEAVGSVFDNDQAKVGRRRIYL